VPFLNLTFPHVYPSTPTPQRKSHSSSSSQCRDPTIPIVATNTTNLRATIHTPLRATANSNHLNIKATPSSRTIHHRTAATRTKDLPHLPERTASAPLNTVASRWVFKANSTAHTMQATRREMQDTSKILVVSRPSLMNILTALTAARQELNQELNQATTPTLRTKRISKAWHLANTTNNNLPTTPMHLRKNTNSHHNPATRMRPTTTPAPRQWLKANEACWVPSAAASQDTCSARRQGMGSWARLAAVY
jgi:hypothetical protein